MSQFDEYQKMINGLEGKIRWKEIDLLPDRPRHMKAIYHSNGYRTVHGIFRDGILENYNYRDGAADTRDMRAAPS